MPGICAIDRKDIDMQLLTCIVTCITHLLHITMEFNVTNIYHLLSKQKDTLSTRVNYFTT